MNKWLFSILLLVTLPNLAWSQDRKIDQLEILYSQNHYTKVIRKANKLLAIPDYDYSGMPTFYKSLAYFKLLSNEEWSKKHKNALVEGIQLYNTFLQHSNVDAYIKSHYFEIAELKQYLIVLEKTYNSSGKNSEAKKINSFIAQELKSITPHGIDIGVPIKTKSRKSKKSENEIVVDHSTDESNKSNANTLGVRTEMVEFALQYLGTPYQWAGNSPNGFDCSGYIGYVYGNYGITLPRSAAAQKEFANHLKDNEAMKGDLAFFKTGNKITHVGLIISNPGEPLKMVHSSTSKGIITTDIHASTYWSKKFVGVGRIID